MADYSELALIRSLNYLAENQAAIAHNLANVDSLGYKRRMPHAVDSGERFQTLLDADLPLSRYREHTDYTNGALRRTGDSFNVAIEGDGFFLVRDDGGRQFYTRKGEMLLDAQGRLTTTSGELYLDRSGQPIELRTDEGAPARDLLIKTDGTIQDSGGGRLGQIGVYDVADQHVLRPAGKTLFTDPTGGNPQVKLDGTLRHKHLERSNVDSLHELVNMITVQRGFQGTARALSAIGRIKGQFIQSVNR